MDTTILVRFIRIFLQSRVNDVTVFDVKKNELQHQSKRIKNPHYFLI